MQGVPAQIGHPARSRRVLTARLPKRMEKTRKPRVGRSLVATLLIAICCGPAAAQLPQPDERSLPYTVQKSDKLIRLSRDLLVTPGAWPEVARFNRMKDPNLIHPGQTLQIPLRLLKHQPASARVVSAEGDVTLAGQRVAVGTVLPEGSSLQTGANSSAIVELGDGSRVKMLPNTQAQVAVNRTYAMPEQARTVDWFAGAMRLARGAVETVAAKITGRASPLEIITPTSTIGVRATEFRVAFGDDPSNSSRAEVTQGQVRADNPAQQSGADLPRGTGAKVNPAEREVRVVQLLAAPDLSGQPAQVLKPQGAWPLPAIPGAASYRVQVASDAAFDKIVRDLKVDGPSVDLGSLDVGSWNVRVRGIDAQGIEGFDGMRTVAVSAQRLRVTQSWLRFEGNRTLLQVELDPPQAGSLLAVIASDPAMGKPLQQATLAGNTWELGTLAPGDYFVRFSRPLPGGGTVSTEVMQLTIPDGWGSSVVDSFNPMNTTGR